MSTVRRFVAAIAACGLLALGSIALATPAQAADDHTAALEGLPAVPELTQTLGQLPSPVTGTVLPEVEQTLNGVPGGAAIAQLLNSSL
ncbi:hypothetical protein AB0K71_23345 [Streptomyces syringium]|uniref:hypothetical protein n=1 Tax=Streptomyces syringium TaxID=76729 RepID=UPI0034389AC3